MKRYTPQWLADYLTKHPSVRQDNMLAPFPGRYPTRISCRIGSGNAGVKVYFGKPNPAILQKLNRALDERKPIVFLEFDRLGVIHRESWINGLNSGMGRNQHARSYYHPFMPASGSVFKNNEYRPVKTAGQLRVHRFYTSITGPGRQDGCGAGYHDGLAVTFKERPRGQRQNRTA